MTRLSRVTQKIFAGSASNNGEFGSAQAGSGVTTSDIATIMSLPAWLNGWLDSVIGGSKFPPLEEFQGVDYVHSTQIAYILQQGIPEYDAGTTYFIDNIVVNPGSFQLFGSITNDNLGNDLSDDTNWKFLVDLSTVGAGNPSYAGGTSTGSANAQVVASLSPSGFTLTNGYTVTFTAGFTNTGATTLNANSTGVTDVYKNSGSGPVALTGGEITSGNTVSATYNSTLGKYILTNAGALLASNNLSDVASAAASLANLGGVSTARQVSAGGLATGGGTLAADRTITVTAATQSDQESGSSSSVAITPGVQQYHPSACKAWVSFNGNDGSIRASYNVTSITRNAIGDYTVNFTVPFSSANYSMSGTSGSQSSGDTRSEVSPSPYNKAAGTCRIHCANQGNGALHDNTSVDLQFFGDQ